MSLTSAPVELTADPAFARRVVRLARTSAVALGVIWLLAIVTLEAHPAAGVSLGLGWLLMPSILMLSVRWPRLRYALALPSALVGLPLLIISASSLPQGHTARTGWLLLTAGILAGSVLGLWFWFRWLPVPHPLHAPFSASRWGLVGVHVTLVVSGILLIAIASLR
jgi:hypothetical protein